MEVADALYGVTMRDDGITTVISQRMRGQELVTAGRSDAKLGVSRSGES